MEAPEQRAARAPQYLAALSATLGAVVAGSTLGFSSPAGLQLTEGTNIINITNLSSPDPGNVTLPGHVFDESFRLDGDKMAWVSSVVNLGALWGGLMGGTSLNVFGRRGTMMMSTIPALAGWLLIAFSVNFTLLVVGRFATGISIGLACISVNTYIGEFASPDIRGTLGTGFQLMVNIGVLMVYVLGVVMQWYHLALVCAAVPVLFAIVMFFNKESPTYLLMKSRTEEAEEALRHFRGPNYNIEPELQAMKTSLDQTRSNQVHITHLLCTPYIAKPFATSLTLMFFQQFSGANAVVFNLSVICKSAGTDLSDAVSSITIGALFVLGTLGGSFFIDRTGRKVMLTVSAVMMCAAHVGLGSFFYALKHHAALAQAWLQWLPLLSLAVFILGLAIGYAPVPWIMMGELFPPNVRGLAGSVVTAANWFFSFIVTASFESLQLVLHDYGVYWLFAAICGVAVFFSVFVVKETKGLTLEEITELFGGPTCRVESGPESQKDGTDDQLLPDGS